MVHDYTRIVKCLLGPAARLSVRCRFWISHLNEGVNSGHGIRFPGYPLDRVDDNTKHGLAPLVLPQNPVFLLHLCSSGVLVGALKLSVLILFEIRQAFNVYEKLAAI